MTVDLARKIAARTLFNYVRVAPFLTEKETSELFNEIQNNILNTQEDYNLKDRDFEDWWAFNQDKF
ncbi:MAG: hypothetical protein R3213_10420 [Flavobacteriaceae bacterium]|nr:hypothetical protein [Flavobacteriaceae bacterium]